VIVGILHPGQMGAAVGAQAVVGGAQVRWVARGRSPATAARAEAAGLVVDADVAELLAASGVVVSLCPPAVAEDVAREVAQHGFTGTYVDANAISPDRFGRIQDIVGRNAAAVVDAAVIGPPPRGCATARLYLAGDSGAVAVVARLFVGTAVRAIALTGPAGAASALKMAFAGYQKSTRTLAAVAHALAARHDVTDALLAEAGRMAGLPLAEPEYLPSVAARAWRWAPEMAEVADTLAAAGLPDDLARAAGTVMAHWRADRDNFDLPLTAVLDRLAR
jgi:3-hydroxyisobutyrate dehydrogenase-like beta-hydroxyacid dehydrogenase